MSLWLEMFSENHNQLGSVWNLADLMEEASFNENLDIIHHREWLLSSVKVARDKSGGHSWQMVHFR